MAGAEQNRLRYGANKYAAFHLILCRWFLKFAQPVAYRYVTLGGTELRDVQSVNFVDSAFAFDSVSFESDRDRYALAAISAQKLQSQKIMVDVRYGNLFGFKREDHKPHIFFIDLEGVFAWADYHIRIGKLLQDGEICEGDALFVTSHLGHNPGWGRVFATFDGEFRILGVTDKEHKKAWYRRAHPAFTLFRALEYANLVDELCLENVGCIEYRDRSPMALYGYSIREGKTQFAAFIRANGAPYYKMQSGVLQPGS